MGSKYFLVTIILFTIFSCSFIVSAQELNTSNSSNITDVTKPLTQSANESDQNGTVSILIKTPSNIDLGSRIPNGEKKAYPDAASLELSSDKEADLMVMCPGDLTATNNSSNIISLDNLEYDGFGNTSLSHKAFTTTYTHVRSWNGTITVPVNLYLTVPIGTKPGTYQTTIYYVVS
jgi:hypothetical protein